MSKGLKKKEYRRGDDEEEEAFLREEPFTRSYKNNNITEWGTTLKAAEMWDKIEECVLETDIGEVSRDEDKKKFWIWSEEKQVKIKVKFFFCVDQSTLKVAFSKK